MQVSGASMADGLAGMATKMSSNQVQQEIAAAILNQIQDSQELAAQSLIKMMEQSVTGLGSMVDVRG
jgi:hypothetical protein